MSECALMVLYAKRAPHANGAFEVIWFAVWLRHSVLN